MLECARSVERLNQHLPAVVDFTDAANGDGPK
jgi:hypothetical protein